MIESEYDIGRVFEDALSVIKQYTGLLDLSLIEKVALRRIAKDSLERLSSIESAENEFPPIGETVAIFLRDYYDCFAITQEDVSFILRIRERKYKDTGYDAIGSYFQKKQEKKHLP